MASVRKRGQTWNVRWRDPGGTERSEAWRTEKKAYARKAEIERLLRHGGQVRDTSLLTVGELWDRWQAVKATTVSDTTLASIKASRRHMASIERVRAVALTRDRVRAWAAENAESCKPATHNKHLTHLRSCLRWGVLEGLLHENPADGVSGVRDEYRERRFLTGAEVELLAAVIDPTYRPWLLLVAWTGLRFSEAAGLRWGDVNLATGAVTVRTQAARDASGAVTRRDTKTGRSRRTVYAPLSVIGELVRPDGAPDSAPVFTGPTGGLLAGPWFARRVFQPACERAGLVDVTPHTLRHSAASLLAASGATVAETMFALGHTRSSLFLELYGHLYAEAGAQVALRLETMRSAALLHAQDLIAALPTDLAHTAHGNVRKRAVRRT